MDAMERHVPEELRGRFVQAFKGQYGYWFEFDGSVRFRDAGGLELCFAYGATLAECRRMMKNNTLKGTGAPVRRTAKAGNSERSQRR